MGHFLEIYLGEWDIYQLLYGTEIVAAIFGGDECPTACLFHFGVLYDFWVLAVGFDVAVAPVEPRTPTALEGAVFGLGIACFFCADAPDFYFDFSQFFLPD